LGLSFQKHDGGRAVVWVSRVHHGLSVRFHFCLFISLCLFSHHFRYADCVSELGGKGDGSWSPAVLHLTLSLRCWMIICKNAVATAVFRKDMILLSLRVHATIFPFQSCSSCRFLPKPSSHTCSVPSRDLEGIRTRH